MTNVPASLPERLADAEGELPADIVEAIDIVIGQASAVIHEAHEGSPESMMRAVARKEQARTALTATILARLAAAESAREAAVAPNGMTLAENYALLGKFADANDVLLIEIAQAKAARDEAVRERDQFRSALEHMRDDYAGLVAIDQRALEYLGERDVAIRERDEATRVCAQRASAIQILGHHPDMTIAEAYDAAERAQQMSAALARAERAEKAIRDFLSGDYPNPPQPSAGTV